MGGEDANEVEEQKPLHEYKKEFRKYTKRFIVYFVFTVIDTVLGSFLFLYIEHCYDVVEKPLNNMEKAFVNICNLIERSNTIIDNSTQQFGEIKSICDNNSDYIETIECGISLKSFCKWFEYTASIAFTTGYGHVVTRSTTGKVVTMFYLIPTIAFTIVSYIHAANMLITMSKIVILVFEKRVMKREKVQCYTMKVFGLQLLVTVLLILASATFYTYNNIANFTFLDAMYFTITSLTTIGFGDFTLDFESYLEQPYQFIILCFLWFFGMGMVASIIAGLGEMVAKYKFGMLFKKVQCPINGCNEPNNNNNIESEDGEEKYQRTILENGYFETFQ